MELRTDNPCDRIGPVLGPQDAVVRHMRALPRREVASALETVRASSEGMPVIKLAFESLVLTAARWGEVRWAEWTEIDRAEGVWTVPATRMKAKREHRVPLCRRATEIVDESRTLGGASPLVFPEGDGKPLFDKRLRRLRLYAHRLCRRGIDGPADLAAHRTLQRRIARARNRAGANLIRLPTSVTGVRLADRRSISPSCSCHAYWSGSRRSPVH